MEHKSSHIASSDYDPKQGHLDVTFANGKTYRYRNVSADLAKSFQSADSTGGFLHSKIAGKYPCRPL